MTTANELVIGVDAGGTSTVVSLAEQATGCEISRAIGGPGNPRVVGFETSTRELLLTIQAAFHSAGIDPAPVAALCLCAAGAGRVEEQKRLQQWGAAHRLAQRITVTGDAEPVLAAASPERIGIALVSGTGSLAWGRSAAGKTDRTGGWGYLFGDEGSGYAIATAGLRAAVQASDGRGGQTTLLPAFLRRLQATDASELIQRIYGTAMPRDQIAALAEVVFASAADDSVAAAIIATAAEDLATSLVTLQRKLGLGDRPYAIGLAGGVLVNQPEFCRAVLAKSGIATSSATLVPAPVVGAVRIACEMQG